MGSPWHRQPETPADDPAQKTGNRVLALISNFCRHCYHVRWHPLSSHQLRHRLISPLIWGPTVWLPLNSQKLLQLDHRVGLSVVAYFPEVIKTHGQLKMAGLSLVNELLSPSDPIPRSIRDPESHF